jgi:PAS domain S-box-containing protein
MAGDTRFRLMFELSADAILLLNARTNQFVDYNAAALDMLACSPAELRSLHPSQLSPSTQPDGRNSFDKANEMIAVALEKGSHRFEWVHRSPHRDDFPVEVLLTPIQLEELPLVVVVWRDITQRKRDEAALRQAQRLESLGVMASGVAHDFNNLLTAMVGHLDLARITVPDGHAAQPHLERLEHAVKRATDLTRQMLAYGGKGSLSLHSLDLSKTVGEVADLLGVSLSRHVRLVLDLPAGLPAVLGDSTQIHQVVMNLVTNAADAMAGHPGTVTLRTGEATLDAAAVQGEFLGQAVLPGHYVTLEVEDTGSGMTQDVVGRIFDPFFTTKQAGRGLGLSSLLGIMKGHRGGVHIRTQVGVGTCFRVVFPASRSPTPEALPAVPAPVASAEPARGGTVLLVDDEASARGSSRALLRYLGFNVVEATDGVEALERYKALDVKPQWVLMDLTMPRLDGHAAFVELRRLDPGIKVVLCSGWAEGELTGRFHGDPPSAFLGKPFTLDALEAMLRRLGLLPAPSAG